MIAGKQGRQFGAFGLSAPIMTLSDLEEQAYDYWHAHEGQVRAFDDPRSATAYVLVNMAQPEAELVNAYLHTTRQLTPAAIMLEVWFIEDAETWLAIDAAWRLGGGPAIRGLLKKDQPQA